MHKGSRLNHSSGRLKKALLYLFGIFIGIILFFCICEAMLQSVYLIRDFKKPKTHYVLQEKYKSPFLYKYKASAIAYPVDTATKINNFSMRRTEDISEVPEENITRILSYGDSIGLGVWMNDGQDYATFLEKLLNQDSSHRYEVLNTARGCCPSIYALHLKSDIMQFKPQIVIMEIELSNDLTDEVLVHYKGKDEFGLP